MHLHQGTAYCMALGCPFLRTAQGHRPTLLTAGMLWFQNSSEATPTRESTTLI